MKTTYFPCVRGTMGDWTYYVTVMGIADLVKYVHFAEEVSPNQDLDTMIQREVSDRSKVIAEYLRRNEQRFFGSLIVAAYDGQPRFRQIKLGDASLLDQIEERVGVLQFDGTEQYYALDGQHRLAAFKTEQERDPERYKSDQVSMIVICHDKDKIGLTRARRLFTTVNRYAKKPSSATHTAMSEDNGVAIVTRRLIREHPLSKSELRSWLSARMASPRLRRGMPCPQLTRATLWPSRRFGNAISICCPASLPASFRGISRSPVLRVSRVPSRGSPICGTE